HFAHELMTEDVAFHHRRNVAVVQMQVGTADRGRSYFDDGVARVENLRLRHILHAHVVLAVPAKRLHWISLPAPKAALPAAALLVNVLGVSEEVDSKVLASRPDVCPSVVGISPASSNCLSRFKLLSTSWPGSLPKSLANNCAALPPGGL